MASKYLQKYQVPEGFYDILHEFTREVLRAQPEDIIEYAANYFEHKAQGREYYYESKYNIQKPTDKYDVDNQKKYNPTPHQNYAEQAKRVVQASNQRVEGGRAQSGHSESNQQEHHQHQQQQQHQRAASGQNGGRPATQNSITSDKPGDTSKISQKSKKSDVSHPEEKKISKEFVGDLYNSALHKALNPASQGSQGYEQGEEEGEEQQNFEGYEEGQYDQQQQYEGGEEEGEGQVQEGEYYEGEEGQQFEGQEQQEEEQQQQEEQEQQQEPQPQQQAVRQHEEVVLDGPLEEYEDVALKIQSAFRNKQAKAAKK